MEEQNQQEPKSNKNVNPIIIGGVVSLLIIGGAIAGYYFINSPDTETLTPLAPRGITPPIEEPIIEPEDTSDWQTYTNDKHGYSLKYPADCFYGPMPGYCKQSPPEERPEDCLCFLNGEDPYGVSFQSLTAVNDRWRMASFSILHPPSDFYNPPAGSDLIDWLKEKNSWEDIPDEINMELDGMPAVRVYTPPSQGAGSQESIYFIMDDKLFNIYMLEVDNEHNREFYNQIISTFRFIDEETTPPIIGKVYNETKHAYFKGVVEKSGISYLNIDFVEWLTATNGGCNSEGLPDCNPNGFLVGNKDEITEAFEVAPNIIVKKAMGGQITFEEFVNQGAEHFSVIPYIFTIEDNVIVDIEEQYIP